MKVGQTLYFDHQATTPVESRVLDKMSPYLRFCANPHSAEHALGWEAARAVEDATNLVAQLIGANHDEVIFTSGATEANNLALLGIGKKATGNSRRRILISTIEHKCVLAATNILKEQYGYELEYIPVNEEGFVVEDALIDTISDDVLLVSIAAVNNEIGTIQNIARLSELIGGVGAIFHCDAAQAPVAIPMNAFTDFVDCLSLSAHKMYGPKGVGVLYIRSDLQNSFEPLIYGGGQQNGLRSGTVPVPLCVGMGAAAEMFSDLNIIEKRLALARHRDDFINRLIDLPVNTFLNGPAGKNRHPGNINLRFSGFNAQDILSALQPHLAASSGSACTTGIPEPSHVLRAIGLNGEKADESIRFSIGFETSGEDIKSGVHLIKQALGRIAKKDS